MPNRFPSENELSAIDIALQRAKIRDDCFGEVRFLDDTPIILSPIEQLPRELVWKIIEYEPDSVCNLKMTSRILNSRVNEYALERETIPLVDSFEIGEAKNSAKRENGLASELIKLFVPMSKSNLFELRVKNYQLERSLKRIFIDESMLEYQLEVDLLRTGDIQRVQEIRDCVGKRVGALIVHWYWREGNSALPFVYDHLSGIHFDVLKIKDFSLSAVLLNALPSIVSDHSVNHISLTVAEVSSYDTIAILLQLSSLVTSIHLKQRNAYRRHNSNYMLGVSDADWGQIVIDIFSRKVDKLCMENECFPEYLPKTAADRLMKELPLIDKKIWFKASCNNYENTLSYCTNGYSVQVESSHAHSLARALTIKHWTRENETFGKL